MKTVKVFKVETHLEDIPEFESFKEFYYCDIPHGVVTYEGGTDLCENKQVVERTPIREYTHSYIAKDGNRELRINESNYIVLSPELEKYLETEINKAVKEVEDENKYLQSYNELLKTDKESLQVHNDYLVNRLWDERDKVDNISDEISSGKVKGLFVGVILMTGLLWLGGVL